MEEKKVGLCIAYTGTNYGQLLQAFATQRAVESLGFKTEIIRYQSGTKKEFLPYYATFYVGCKKIFRKLKKNQNNNETQLDTIHLTNMEQRKNVSEKFREKFLQNVVKCNGLDELKSKSKDYFAVIVGSDQVWLPDISVTSFYTLRFATQGVRRISYATSMGVSEYPKYARRPAIDYWKKIDYLSVREEQAKKIIQSIENIPVEVVLDPTYLFNKEKWLEFIPDNKVTDGKYIFCYFLGNNEKIKKIIKNFAEKKQLKIVCIMSDECNSKDSEYADEILVGKGPDDFINLIRHAEYIFTDSFHGVAFSVINEKQFYVFYREREDTSESRNSRIDNIVKTWDLENRLLTNLEGNITDEYIDYKKVNKRREELKNKSWRFLKKSLSMGE